MKKPQPCTDKSLVDKNFQSAFVSLWLTWNYVEQESTWNTAVRKIHNL